MFSSMSPFAARVCGFATGVILPLALAGLVAVGWGGGLSDTRAAPEPVYIVE
jgi:hypothetical protein